MRWKPRWKRGSSRAKPMAARSRKPAAIPAACRAHGNRNCGRLWRRAPGRRWATGVIRVGASDGSAQNPGPASGELSRRHPGLTIELAPAPRSFSLSQREADIAVTVDDRNGRLLVRKLTTIRSGSTLLRAISEYAARPAARPVRDRLVGYVEDLIYSSDLDFTGEFLKDWRSHVAVSTIAGQIEVIRSGAGVGILPAFMARAFPNWSRCWLRMSRRAPCRF